MKTLVFFVEELSAKALIQGIVSRMFPTINARFVVFEGKQDLEKQLTRKLRGWILPDCEFVVLRDQDRGDCKRVKAKLVSLVQASGKQALVRVACRELEAWILGDLEAFAKEFGTPRAQLARSKEKYRDPDRLGDPVAELRSFVPNYQKVEGARRMGMQLSAEGNHSGSFRAFVSGLRRLAAQA